MAHGTKREGACGTAHGNKAHAHKTPHASNLVLPPTPALPDQQECDYRGVRWKQECNKWRVRAKTNGMVRFLMCVLMCVLMRVLICVLICVTSGA